MSQLFSQKYSSVTFKLIMSWLSIYFIYYAVTLLLPTILQRLFFKNQASRQFEYIYLAGLSALQFICYIVSPMLMNHPALGRKKLYILVLLFSVSVGFWLFCSEIAVLSVFLSSCRSSSVRILSDFW